MLEGWQSRKTEQIIYARLSKNRSVLSTPVFLFIEILFIYGETWKQPRCPLVGEWIN